MNVICVQKGTSKEREVAPRSLGTKEPNNDGGQRLLLSLTEMEKGEGMEQKMKCGEEVGQWGTGVANVGANPQVQLTLRGCQPALQYNPGES